MWAPDAATSLAVGAEFGLSASWMNAVRTPGAAPANACTSATFHPPTTVRPAYPASSITDASLLIEACPAPPGANGSASIWMTSGRPVPRTALNSCASVCGWIWPGYGVPSLFFAHSAVNWAAVTDSTATPCPATVVVRSSVASCTATGTSSAVQRTSTFIIDAPCRTASNSAADVFSGNGVATGAPSPRWAITGGAPQCGRAAPVADGVPDALGEAEGECDGEMLMDGGALEAMMP